MLPRYIYILYILYNILYILFIYIYYLYIYIYWYDMIWYDMIWLDMIWYDMIWYVCVRTYYGLSLLPTYQLTNWPGYLLQIRLSIIRCTYPKSQSKHFRCGLLSRSDQNKHKKMNSMNAVWIVWTARWKQNSDAHWIPWTWVCKPCTCTALSDFPLEGIKGHEFCPESQNSGSKCQLLRDKPSCRYKLWHPAKDSKVIFEQLEQRPKDSHRITCYRHLPPISSHFEPPEGVVESPGQRWR